MNHVLRYLVESCAETRKGYIYTTIGRVALIFQTELTE